MDNDSAAAVATDPRPQKRPASGAEGRAARRPKRGKYTSVACDECKKRKLKCIPVAGASCERCIAGGQACAYAPGPSQGPKSQHESQQVRNLSDEMAQLRQQIASLVQTVTKLKDQPSGDSPVSSRSQDTTNVQSHASAPKGPAPKQPQFVGPTRPAFALMVGERSLTRMGIPTYESFPPSGAQSPTDSPADSQRETTTAPEFWHRCTTADVASLLAVFEEEVGSVYPFIDVVELSSRAPRILDFIRNRESSADQVQGGPELAVTQRDVEILTVAVATAIVIEAHGKTELSNTMAESVELHVSRISSPAVELQEIQLLTMLSIYYFHSDEELLAWRTIGIAAREALEMGLHRRKSLFDNFEDPESRHLAMRVFWCVYVLDRRWSFGTSLPFALADRDIDPSLPEPDSDLYLKCMVGYGRLCSKLWNAIPSFGSPSQTIPDATARSLDLSTQDWLESIPSHLQLRHPRLGLTARSQPRVLQRLRALLYLRGNRIRISIYQHHLLSATSISANLRSAWLVVEIAQDSVQVLVHLNATTDIYSRQQNAFNYFLISALAVIFLAVCHAPNVFTEPCRQSLLDAVELVRGFSRHSLISRRLWKSIRGLLPRLRSLGLDGDQSGAVASRGSPTAGTSLPATGTMNGPRFRETPDVVKADEGNGFQDMQSGNQLTAETYSNSSVPDMFQMGSDLLNLFDALGQGQIPGEFSAQYYGSEEPDTMNGGGGEIARRFQGFI